MTKGSGGKGSSGGRGSSGFWRKKKTSSVRPFKDFHADWIETLRSTLLPLLHHSMAPPTGGAGSSSSSSGSGIVVSPLAGGGLISSSDLLSTHSAALLSHFQAYYHALDLAAGHDPSQLFAPLDWRSPIEKPFLWLGDFHPSLFTNLLRSLDSTSQTLIPKIEQIECGIRLMAPSIFSRFRDAQALFADRSAAEWAVTRGKEDLNDNLIKDQMVELESIFGDANRLRRSVLGEILGAADVYQGAMFLGALAEFVVGFWDEDLIHEFELCKVPLSP